MLRPSTDRGMPAFGCAARGREVTARTRSIAFQHRHRPHTAIDAEYVHLPFRQPRRKGLGVGAVEAVAVFVDRDLGDEGKLRIHVAASQHGLVQLFEVAEGFEHQQIDAAFDERRGLFAKRRTRLVERSLAQRFDANAQRSHRSRNPGIETLGRLPSQANARHIDVAHAVHQAVPRQAKAVRAESVGFDDLGARLQIIVVDVADQLRLRQVQLVIAAVDEDALGIEQRPHGSIAEHRRLLQTFQKILRHLLEDTRSRRVSASWKAKA